MKQLYRPRSNRIFAGVCGGLAEYIGVNAIFIRAFFVFAFLSGFAGFWAYLLLYFLMPHEDRLMYSASHRPQTVYIRRPKRRTVDVPVDSGKRKRKNDEVIHYARPIRDDDDFYDEL
jgi:phage shock protein C